MEGILRNILICLRASRFRQISTDELTQTINRLKCNLHLIYQFPAPLFRRAEKNTRLSAQKKLLIYEIQNKLTEKLDKGLVVHSSYTIGSSRKRLINYALSNEIDLIFTEERNRYFGLFKKYNADELAWETNCAVFTGPLFTSLLQSDNIVLPIGNSLPITRLRIAVCLARQLNTGIHLIPLKEKNGMAQSFQNLKRAYQLLKNNTDINLRFSMNEFSENKEKESHNLLIRDLKSELDEHLFRGHEYGCRIEQMA